MEKYKDIYGILTLGGLEKSNTSPDPNYRGNRDLSKQTRSTNLKRELPVDSYQSASFEIDPYDIIYQFFWEMRLFRSESQYF